MNPSEPGLLILHAVRLAGFVDTSDVADRLGLPVADDDIGLAV